MKNHWLIVITAAAALSFTGCNKPTEKAESDTAAEKAATPADETPASYDAQPATPESAPVATPAADAAAPADAATSAPQAAAEQTLPSGTRYTDLIVGTGNEAQAGNVVSVHYTGTLEDGTKFDSSRDRNQPFDFPLGGGQVIKGWDEGVAGMKVGGRRSLVIPADQAYGNRQMGPIPPNSTLLFEVDLLAIK